MGVMLALDRPAPARGRRHGQHARSSAVQAPADALAAFLRASLPAGGGRAASRPGAGRPAVGLPADRRPAVGLPADRRPAVGLPADRRRGADLFLRPATGLVGRWAARRAARRAAAAALAGQPLAALGNGTNAVLVVLVLAEPELAEPELAEPELAETA